MKRFNLIKNEDGAVMPLVALVLSIVLLGFAALVVDAGILYAERRTMVTAADAAALAGAMEMRGALGTSDIDAAKGKAKEVAKRIAIANGVKNIDDEDNIEVIIGQNPDYGRETITVKVHNNKKLIFAKFLGFDDTDVGAKSVATWGYVRKLLGGDLLPIFTKNSDYEAGKTTYLHNGKFEDNDGDIISGNWGLIDVFKSASKIETAFSGEKVEANLTIDAIIKNQTGQVGGNIVGGIEKRMKTADTLNTKEERQRFMSGLVPVIDWTDKDTNNPKGSHLQLPIKYFAVFEILDVIVDGGKNNTAVGSKHVLYDSGDYKSKQGRVKGIEYPLVNEENLEKFTIIGRFTGETVDIVAVMQPGDQDNPNPDGPSPKYHKLIE